MPSREAKHKKEEHEAWMEKYLDTRGAESGRTSCSAPNLSNIRHETVLTEHKNAAGDTQVPDTVTINVTPTQLELLLEALDSHEYWGLSDDHYRNSGFVSDPGSDDPDTAETIGQVRALVAMLEGFKK